MKVEYIKFPSRSVRSEYVAKRYRKYLCNSVLDVGCDDAALKKFIPGDCEYVGMDIAGKPTVHVDLEEVERLPFDDNRFHCVVCTDVLEHIDNLHHTFEELLRVSKRYLIVSLPNCWSVARQPIRRGKGHFSHYGLPTEKPQDRHKWFFNISEARAFFLAQEKRLNFKIQEMHATDKPRATALRALRRIRYLTQQRYLNRYSNTLWVVIEKAETPSKVLA